MTDTGSEQQRWRMLFIFGTVTVLLLCAFLFVHIFQFAHVFQLFLIMFGATLVGVCFQGLTAWVSERTGLPWFPTLSGVLLLLVGAVGAFAVLAGPQIVEQIITLIDRIPADLAKLEETIARYEWGQALLERLPPADEMVPPRTQILGSLSGIFSTALDSFTSVVIVLVVGMYLAVSPDLYREGILHLVPREHRERAGEVMQMLGRALRWWLVGRFTSMAVVGVMTMAGLWLIGVPLPLALGFIAGGLAFVPYFGPILSAVPAVLIGLGQSPLAGLYVLLVYSGIQLLEGYVITPQIQQRAVSLPPALLLTAQFFMGFMFGFIGLLLATPLTVSVIVLIQALYVQGVLGDDVEVLGEHRGW
mgnify:CR=1 FL=1